MRVGATAGWSGFGSRFAALMAMLLAIAGGGCGGDDSDSSASERPKYAAADEPPRVFAERLAKLLATTTAKRDCGELEEIARRSLTRFPCPPNQAFRKSMANFEIVGVEEHYTGAIVDYTSGRLKKGATIVMFTAPTRKWAVSRFGVVTPPSTDTSDEDSREGFRETLNAYLEAIRKRDCKAFTKVALIVVSTPREVCAKLFLDATRGLRNRMKANPGVRPRYRGGNSAYGFFTFETPQPDLTNTTFSVVKATDKSGSPYVVLDATPSPTSLQQRAAIELLEQSEKSEQPETSPSRKAD